MASKLKALALVLIGVATLLHGTAAQTRHVVGGGTGWTIPSGGASTYTTWASNQSFNVGDTLVFNFTNGQHTVAEVTKAAFDACNTGNTIFTLTSSPANVKLNESGEHYYICTVASHCSLGQKLAINVTQKAASSPAPRPSPPPKSSPAPEPTSPSPSPAAAPASSTGSVTYTVGDKMGWTVPTNGASSYQTWASGKPFKVGDILVFNFPKNVHNVAEVTRANFGSCNTTSPLAMYTDPPARVTLNKSGEHYFICAIPGHCAAGQKLAINVTAGGSTATSPSSPAATPPSTAASPNSPPSTTNPSSPSPTGAAGAASPPQNSAATSLGAAGLSTTMMMWIAAALLY